MNTELEQGKFQGMVITKLDSLQEMCLEIKACLKDHETRLQKIERHQAQMKVIASLFGTVAGGLVAVLMKLLVK